MFPSRLQVLLLMQVAPASEDDRLAKAALYTKFTGKHLTNRFAVYVVATVHHASGTCRLGGWPGMDRKLQLSQSDVLRFSNAGGRSSLPLHPALRSAAETLPAAVRRWRQLGVPLLLELLAGVRAAVEGAVGAGSSGSGAGGGRGGRTLAQQLFAQAQAFLQVANILNEEYPEVRGDL